MNVLLYAADQGKEKVEEVLSILEAHHEKHLQFQHPEIRGTVDGPLGINPTGKMFSDLCCITLGLQAPE